jgi:hypothetical protein
MNYQEMYKAIADNHSAHWGGDFAEMVESDKKIAQLEIDYPELFAEALEAHNEKLRSF